MIVFGNETRVDLSWADFKSLVSAKSLFVQYETTDETYEIFAIEDNVVYHTSITLGQVPYTSTITQGDNDTNKSDFESNYQPTANKRTVSDVSLVDLSGSRVTVIDDTVNPSTEKRLQVETRIAPNSQVVSVPNVASTPDKMVKNFLLHSGSSDLKVDGSSSPKEFTFNADPTSDIYINQVRFIVTTDVMNFRGDYFFEIKDPLPNGVKLEIKSNGTLAELANLKISEDFLTFPSPYPFILGQAGAQDHLMANYELGGRTVLKAGSGDFVKVTIRDNINTAKIKWHFSCQVHGFKV